MERKKTNEHLTSPKNQNLLNPSDLLKEENRGFSNLSEQIANFMIEKIISLTLTEVARNETNRQIPKKCFLYMSNMIKSFLKLEFLPHDRDDLYVNTEKERDIPLLLMRSESKSTNEIKIKEIKEINIKKLKKIVSENNNNNLNNEGKSQKSHNTPNSNSININTPNNNNNNMNINIQEIEEEKNNEKNLDSSDSEFHSNNSSAKSLTEESKIERKTEKSISADDSVKLDSFICKENVGNKGDIYMDNYIYGLNDWTIMDEPVIFI